MVRTLGPSEAIFDNSPLSWFFRGFWSNPRGWKISKNFFPIFWYFLMEWLRLGFLMIAKRKINASLSKITGKMIFWKVVLILQLFGGFSKFLPIDSKRLGWKAVSYISLVRANVFEHVSSLEPSLVQIGRAEQVLRNTSTFHVPSSFVPFHFREDVKCLGAVCSFWATSIQARVRQSFRAEKSYGVLKDALKRRYVGQYTEWVLHVRTKIQKCFVLTAFKMLDSNSKYLYMLYCRFEFPSQSTIS